jgi:succinoglycan biosynthesis transport protein ExoP
MPIGTPQTKSTDLELGDYLRILRRRRGVVLMATVAVGAAAVIASARQTPVYAATAEVLLEPRRSESLFNPNTGARNDPARAVETEIRVLKSRPVEEAVRRELGPVPRVSARPLGQTDVIALTAESTSPRRSARVVNAYARAYIDFRRQQAVDDALAGGKGLQAKIDDLQRQIDELNGRVAAAPTFEREVAERSVAPSRQALIGQQALFKQMLSQLQVEAGLSAGGAQLVTPAEVPTSPVRPQPLRRGALGVAVGFGFGFALALLKEHFDDSVKVKEDVEQAVAGVPILGVVPAVAKWRNGKTPLTVSLTDPRSSTAEAYRMLRTSIQLMGVDPPVGTLQVTSPAQGEGKTTTVANLAVTLAHAGHRVLVIDCDLRRPRVHEFFGLHNKWGFVSVLAGQASLNEAIQDVHGVDRLRLLASGPLPPNPAELLSSERTAEILATAKNDADVVLIDCPPVLPVTDAAVLSSWVDATLLVASAGATRRRQLARADELLSQVDARIIGTVLNGLRGDGHDDGYSYYRYYQREGDAPRGRRKVAASP